MNRAGKTIAVLAALAFTFTFSFTTEHNENHHLATRKRNIRQPNLGPDHDLAIRLSTMESNIAALQTRDVLQNASIGAGGLTVNGGAIIITGAGSLAITGTGSFTTNGNISTTGASSASTSITAGTTIAAGGALTGATLSTTGTANIGGLFTADPGMSSLDAKTRVLTSGWSSLWIDGSGRIGQSGSAHRFKQDIQPADIDTTEVLNLTPVQYRLKAAVEEFGVNARNEIGLIAEDLEPVAPWAIACDAEGAVQGINYDILVVVLLAVAQAQQAQIDTLTNRLKTAGL